ncbi:hypothetical protein ACIGHB_32375 [Streptomyces sp. NPDC085460]|uniref:hypothetical protein n=1 Tax=Streptomyces sp. NPDC085460 TaxID=3365723 RepID=UPI0037CFACBD
MLGLLALAAATGLGTSVPEKVVEERAFLDARPCADGETATDPAECLRTIRATVLSTEEIRSGKSRHFRVLLRAPVPAPADRPLDLDTDSDLSEDLKPGDEVSVTVWRDVRVSVRHGEVSDTVDPRPDDEVGPFAGLTLACLWLAVLGFLGALGAVRRSRRRADGGSFPRRVGFGPAKIAGVLGVPLLLGFVAGRVWDGWTVVVMTGVISVLVAAQATIFALRVDR